MQKTSTMASWVVVPEIREHPPLMQKMLMADPWEVMSEIQERPLSM
jgi:hypothetical protein